MFYYYQRHIKYYRLTFLCILTFLVTGYLFNSPTIYIADSIVFSLFEEFKIAPFSANRLEKRKKTKERLVNLMIVLLWYCCVTSVSFGDSKFSHGRYVSCSSPMQKLNIYICMKYHFFSYQLQTILIRMQLWSPLSSGTNTNLTSFLKWECRCSTL